MKPLVSVIIATHNRAEFIAETVESAIGQTYRRIEIIVVDDGSTDDTRQVLKKYENKIKYIYQDRAERSKARNRGFRYSQGEYIAFLDSDDIWLPQKIEKQVKVLNERQDVGLVYVDVQFIDAKGEPHSGGARWDTRKRDVLYEDLMTNNIVTGTTSSAMIRRSCLDKVGLFDETMNTCEDLDLYRRISEYYPFHAIASPLVRFRVHDTNTQRNASAMARGWETIVKKISAETPSRFDYYKNEAIVRILAQIAGLYRQDGRIERFLLFLGRSLFSKPNWLLRLSFWRDLFRLYSEKYFTARADAGN
ncbi:MAG: glycosyltransferase [Thermodesulfobacteriota bacterium]|nr:glycosyltransferase [Thermodesulfobacteriota bacterium]